ncbi:MAG: hypothetical protein WBD40_21935, partial [Tepidisphaeraceae bacterium]
LQDLAALLVVDELLQKVLHCGLLVSLTVPTLACSRSRTPPNAARLTRECSADVARAAWDFIGDRR